MIRVETSEKTKKIHNFWNNIIFHPTDAIEDDWGKRILDQISDDGAVDTVRIYNMLEDIVTQDENGNLCYDYTLNDYRLDYLLSKGYGVFLTYAFVPPFLAVDSSLTSACAKGKTRYKGKMIITSPPKDYAVWEEICYQYTVHIVERYGLEEVKKWHLQCWNEPDIAMFFRGDLGKSDEDLMIRLHDYLNVYRAFARGVKRVSKEIKIGQSIAKHFPFLDGFLKTTLSENIPIDFVSLHSYGTSPNRIRTEGEKFDACAIYNKYAKYKEIIDRYYPTIEVMIDEWGAASGGFYNREECPDLMFREGSDYAAYMGKMIYQFIEHDASLTKMMICLSGQHEMKVDFSGFRNFFTLNFIHKPIYNAYILLRKLGENGLKCTWDRENLCAIATSDASDHITLMVAYASENFNKVLPPVDEEITLNGLSGKRTVTTWILDENNVNPYKMALRNGWGADDYTPEQLAALQEEGILRPYSVQEVDFDKTDKLDVSFDNNALVLIQID